MAGVTIRKIWLGLSLLAVMLLVPAAKAQSCTSPANPIVAENCLTGNAKSEWDISGAGSSNIQGFATDISVNRGGTIQFKIKANNATAYRIDIYRSGYYQGLGARKVATFSPSVSLPQSQPNCLTNASTGLIDCGNWAVSASWAVPATAVSGVYFAKLTATSGTTGSSHILFVVRDDSSTADIFFQTSDATWQAYNEWGGNSLYAGSPAGRAYKVSYNRPFATRADSAEDFYFSNEYPMVRFMERNGYDIAYTTNVDTDRRGADLLKHKVFFSVGHDEYWSGNQRTNVENARAQGIHLAFFSGNEVFWKTRWENSIDASGTSYRTLVCYKETLASAKIDPTPAWTGTWRDPRFSPPADGGRPENGLTGTRFMVNEGSAPIRVSQAEGKNRFWRNTSFASLGAGQTGATVSGVIGYEADEAPQDAFTPSGLVRLSTTTYNANSYLLDYGSDYGSGTSTHNLTLYRHPSGALVFGAGTIRWSWGLDNNHDISGPAVDSKMQQAMINLMADMGVQPTTIMSGLTPTVGSPDTTAPVSTITSPAAGTSLAQGSPVTVTGTASDVGGIVTAVEVSADNGATWSKATGTTSWTFSWWPGATGTVTLKTRAFDDSLNIEIPGSGVPYTVTGRVCPCTIWPSTATPAVLHDSDTAAIEVGLKFTSSENGTITAIRFYKGPQNTGTHTGKLWTSSGTQLANVTFINETASGWQQANFATPVPITAGVTYVASYRAPVGRYSTTPQGLTSAVLSPPLRAPSSSEAGGNGLYRYGASGFPNRTYNAEHYWVDVVFVGSNSDTTAPVISSVSATPSTSSALIAWTTDEASNSIVNYGTSAASLNQNATVAAMVTDHALSLTGLTPGTYYYRVTSADAAGNSSSSPVAPATLSFTIVDNTPPVISGLNSSVGDTSATITWTTNEQSTTVVNWGASPDVLDQTLSNSAMILAHSMPITGLPSGATFYYRVNSVDASGNSSTSPIPAGAPASFTTTVPAPPVISAVSVSAGNTTATITWTTNKVSNSIVNYGTDPGTLNQGVTVATMVTAHSIPLSGLAQGVTYYFRVTSVDGSALSATSPNPPAAPASFTTTSMPAPVISAVTATAGLDGTATIKWTTNVASTTVVDYGTSAASLNLTFNNSSLVTAHTANLTGLAYGTTYYFRVTSLTSGSAATSPAIPAAPLSFAENLISLFPSTAVPGTAAEPDNAAVVVGMKFRSDVAGVIRAIRFYKGSGNTGTHTARIYSSTGTSLASVTFSGETATGWQQQNLTTPLAITANTTYVVSYYAPVGRYAADETYFTSTGVDRGPLHAPSGANGVYRYGNGSGFPNQTYDSTNYWVDIVFSPNP